MSNGKHDRQQFSQVPTNRVVFSARGLGPSQFDVDNQGRGTNLGVLDVGHQQPQFIPNQSGY